MAKNKIVIANHKMNMLSSDINIYLKKIKEQINIENVIICPSCIYIPYFLKQNFKVGIQNIFYKSKGAYTGEISPRQAKSMEVDYAIVGHSERRKYFLETNNEINQKIELCLKNNLKVILCIGENKEEKYEDSQDEISKDNEKQEIIAEFNYGKYYCIFCQNKDKYLVILNKNKYTSVIVLNSIDEIFNGTFEKKLVELDWYE